MGMIVELADVFSARYCHYPTDDQTKIAEFILHVQQHGLTGLHGKIARSTNVPGHDRDYHTKYQYARDHYLWHYHIGIPCYVPSRNVMAPYMTSEYVLHFQRFPCRRVIRLLDLDYHDPMSLPPPRFLTHTPKSP